MPDLRFTICDLRFAIYQLRLSMNQARASNRYLGKAALKTHALQTLTRRPLPWPARSVWSASDLSALSVRRGTASGSWFQCMRKNEGTSTNVVAQPSLLRVAAASRRQCRAGVSPATVGEADAGFAFSLAGKRSLGRRDAGSTYQPTL